MIKNPLRTFLGLIRKKIRTSRLGKKKGVLIKKSVFQVLISLSLAKTMRKYHLFTRKTVKK